MSGDIPPFDDADTHPETISHLVARMLTSTAGFGSRYTHDKAPIKLRS